MSVPETVAIDRVQSAGDYKLRLRFSDGAERVIDFAQFLQTSRNPLIREFLDEKKFAESRLHEGDLIWGDYELCFPIADLYQGRL